MFFFSFSLSQPNIHAARSNSSLTAATWTAPDPRSRGAGGQAPPSTEKGCWEQSLWPWFGPSPCPTLRFGSCCHLPALLVTLLGHLLHLSHPGFQQGAPNTSTAPPQHLVQGSGEGRGPGMRWPQLRGAGHKLQTQAIHSPNPAPAGPRWVGWGQFTPRCSGHPQANVEPPLNPPAFSYCWRKARCLAKAPRSRRKNRNKKEQRGREAPTAL